ncbi:CDP-diacylglycerol--glycerol-3-phosphate 3-phosphatidyltransferase [Oscillospiraceae bacterium PP1C4]
MNLPNKLTLLRMGLIPVFLVFMLAQSIPHNFLWAAIVFAVASFTDFLDGYIARRDHLVTDFGKLMDPLADKLLVVSALVCFVETGWASALMVFIILAREFLVTSVRLIAAGSGKVLAADRWGKLKTVFQIIWVLYTLLIQWYVLSIATSSASMPPDFMLWGVIVLGYLVVLLTVFSGFNYVWKNRSLFSDIK